MDLHQRVAAVDRVEDPPVTHRIFVQVRQIGRDRFMTEVVHVRRDPFGLLEEALIHGRLDGSEIVDDGGMKGEAVPGHKGLPAEAELVGDFLTRKALPVGEGGFEARTEGLSELQSQIGVTDQLAQTIVDQPAYQVLELFGCQRRKIHVRRIRFRMDGKQPA